MPFLQTRGGGSASGFGVGSGSAEAFITASGGQLTASWYDGTYEWQSHFFLDSGNSTFTLTDIPAGSDGLNFVIVGGGGGGAGGHDADWFGGGGGGAGGAVYKTGHKPNAGNYTITVGIGPSGGSGSAAGAGAGTGNRGGTGGSSSAFSYTANGGGAGNPSGVANPGSDCDGGCGGGTGSGTGYNQPGVSNRPGYGDASSYGGDGGQGYSTGAYPFGSGGGGLAGFGGNVNTAAGGHESEDSGIGGNARTFVDIFGTGTICNLGGGGGGGGAGGSDTDYNGGSAGDGGDGGGSIINYDAGIGAGGGGRGGRPRINQRNGHFAAINTGGGGGGGCGGPAGPNGSTGTGGAGGRGVVIVSYKKGTAPAQAGSGRTAATAATSAKAIITNFPGSPDGLYWIAPTGGVGAQLVFCDMTTDGGGWMHVATFHDNQNVTFQAQPEVSPWGFFLHRTNGYAYTTDSNHGGRFCDNVFDEFVGVHYPLAFGANFKHPGLYSYAPVRQVLMKDQGPKLRNLWYTEQLGSAVSNTRVWFGDGSNMWVDNGTSRNSTSVGFRNLAVSDFGQTDDVFGSSPTRVIFGYGEPSGVDTSNQDRSMITRYGTSDSVSITQGIGVSRGDAGNTSVGSPSNGTYQVYRNVDPVFRDQPEAISSVYNYTMWIRE